MNGKKAQGMLTTNVQLSEPKGSRSCENLKKPRYSIGRGLECYAMLPMRKVIFTGLPC